MTSLLFVCLGNICRSPLAEGIFRQTLEEAGLARDFLLDSAGTGAWHAGNPPDPRSVEVAARHGIDISTQKARQVSDADFSRFEWILAMDRDNLAALRRKFPNHPRLRLLLTGPDRDVPDPYYGGSEGFDQVFDMLQSGSRKLLSELRKT
ncbi:low molecular weight protein-tyrosine-phosphatase [Roseibium suaedae]|uniref:protein-tyrosine-phosphatase n=1 Tax=Roseibium suaedae TaxID=735517 RepID=A0A1M7N1L0_9HYPH|nr:low molecular weight protein-tyrosine-phosphatase [Roseibium suaedae]SHM97372.1 protein-tyrosine phosphatase [Roseibium suaedae]